MYATHEQDQKIAEKLPVVCEELPIQEAEKVAIHSFNENSLVSEVNDISNLIPLCPNCHWEFDNLPR